MPTGVYKRTEKHIKICSLAFLGRHHTQEAKLAIGLASLGRKHSSSSKLKSSKSKLEQNNPRWEGGKSKDRGYLLIKSNNHPSKNSRNYVREHRLVMEKHLSRYLDDNEVVHHINGIKDDNRLENLQLMDKVEHFRFHRLPKLIKNRE